MLDDALTQAEISKSLFSEVLPDDMHLHDGHTYFEQSRTLLASGSLALSRSFESVRNGVDTFPSFTPGPATLRYRATHWSMKARMSYSNLRTRIPEERVASVSR